jgi:hypothetical protein
MQQEERLATMPIVQFRDHLGNDVKGKQMAYPKNLQRPESWLTSARKAIPTVPDPQKTDWRVVQFDTSLDIVMIELQNRAGQKCRLGILRESGMRPK